MTIDHDRRRMMHLSLLAAALPSLMGKTGSAFADNNNNGTGAEHDFDFFLGDWQVRHRRLKKRLANNHEWEEYGGTSHWQSILGGIANINESIVNRSGNSYRGLGMRAFDAKTNLWADWYLDGRDPTKVDVHGVGRFVNGVGTFFYDDTFDGRPIKVRGMFSPLTADSMQWEQAFSPDGGTTWETNLVMHHTRIG